MARISDILYNIIDSVSQRLYTYKKVTTYYDGTAMDDSKCDSFIYRKKGSEYFKRLSFSSPKAQNFGIVGDGTDKTALLNTVLAKPHIHTLVFDDDEMKTITINGNVNCRGKMLMFRNGVALSGSGTINNVDYKCGRREACFIGDLAVTNVVNEEVNLMHFGACGDYEYLVTDGTDNYPILVRAMNAFGADQEVRIYIPKQTKFYNFHTNPGEINRVIHIRGDGESTPLLMDGTQLGFKLLGEKSSMKDLYISGHPGQVSAGYNSPTAHGIWVSSNNTIIDNVYIRSFDGDGLLLAGDVNIGTNANLSKAINCKIHANGRANIHTKGGDANIELISGCDATGAGRFNYWLEDFLGNTAVGCHSASAAIAHNHNKTVVRHNGTVYWAVADSLNVEPGTNANVWVPVGLAPYFEQAWSNVTQYYSGYGFYISGANQQGVVLGCYSEFDELINNESNSLILGGFAARYGSIQGAIGMVESKITSIGWQAMHRNETTNPSVWLNATNEHPSIEWNRSGQFSIGFWQRHIGRIATMYAQSDNSTNQFWSSPQDPSFAAFTGRDRGIQNSRVHYMAGGGLFLGAANYNNNYNLVGFADAPPVAGDFGQGDILLPTHFGNISTGVLYWQCTVASVNGNGGTWEPKHPGPWLVNGSDIRNANAGKVIIGLTDIISSNNPSVLGMGATSSNSNGNFPKLKLFHTADHNPAYDIGWTLSPGQLDTIIKMAGVDKVFYLQGVEMFRIKNGGSVRMANVPNYADTTAAIAGGLINGDVYHTDGVLKIVYPVPAP